jgi:Family of unknown function (DUF6804)
VHSEEGTTVPQYAEIQKRLTLGLIIATLIAIFPVGYGYYSLLRLAMMLGCGFLAYQAYATSRINNRWMWILAALAITFNAIAPIGLPSEAWMIIDLLAAGALWQYRNAIIAAQADNAA